MNTPVLTNSIDIRQADPATLRWVENQLAIGGYLADCQNNGLIGQATLDALAAFKADAHLEYPHALGASTIDALSRLEAPHPISEQTNFDLKPDPQAGRKSGRLIRLPIVGEVYLNEWIVANSFITYSEFTHGGSRIPTTETQARNMLRIAEEFGWIRRTFGSAIGITSAFRPEHINRAVGGAPNSWHIRAAALDIYPINGRMADLTEVIKASDVGGIGTAARFRHIDLGDRRFWRYGR
ncbi:MAG: hypothetical protein HC895_13865 [Leptolyngbyaceae cyanobacterium SM1_3_5]|nr:hypothetical protein [Leptolyngbyaceae cyanobacterium SM1_3_5]